MSIKISETIALVTGANRGIGFAVVEALYKAGAKKVYAAARNIESLKQVVAIDSSRIIPIALDVTNSAQIEAAVNQATDINFLINNTGVLGSGGIFAENSVETAKWEMDVNYFGTLSMIRAFAPILKQNGGGAIANLCSVASFVNVPAFATYSISKAALYSLTQAARAELASQNTLVIGIYPGPVDTPMAAKIPMDKVSTSQIADALLQGIENAVEDIYPDIVSEQTLSAISPSLKNIEKQFAQMLP